MNSLYKKSCSFYYYIYMYIYCTSITVLVVVVSNKYNALLDSLLSSVVMTSRAMQD
jgi:c-di-AMP phosphodiesterase-like protein